MQPPYLCFLQGCKVIGFAGTEEKCKWIKEELGFDFAYNYKKTDVDTALKEAAPDNSVDCYFDNVWFKGLFGSSLSLYVIVYLFNSINSKRVKFAAEKLGDFLIQNVLSNYSTVNAFPCLLERKLSF